MCPYAIGANVLSLLSSHPSQSYSNQSEFNFKILTITFALLIQNFQNNKCQWFQMQSRGPTITKGISRRVYKIGFNVHDAVGVDPTSKTKSQQVSKWILYWWLLCNIRQIWEMSSKMSKGSFFTKWIQCVDSLIGEKWLTKNQPPCIHPFSNHDLKVKFLTPNFNCKLRSRV